jgi:hypothetical protein
LPKGAGIFVRFYETLANGTNSSRNWHGYSATLGWHDWLEKHCIIATENDFVDKLIDFWL